MLSSHTETPGALPGLPGRPPDARPDRRQVTRHVGYIRPPVDLAVPLEVLLSVLYNTHLIFVRGLDVIPL